MPKQLIRSNSQLLAQNKRDVIVQAVEIEDRVIESIQMERDKIFGDKWLVRKDGEISRMVRSLDKSQTQAQLFRARFRYNFQKLKKKLRTDQDLITQVDENVPINFQTEYKDDCAYFYLQKTVQRVSYQKNYHSTFKVEFDCRAPIQVYISNQNSRPTYKNCDLHLKKSGQFTSTIASDLTQPSIKFEIHITVK